MSSSPQHAREPFPPIFATNRPTTGERVADELNGMLRTLRKTLKEPPHIAIATAYLNPAGFNLLADEIEQSPAVRLLIGAEPQSSSSRTGPTPEQAMDLTLRTERDLTGFTLAADLEAQRLVAWLRLAEATGKPRVDVRQFKKGFLHGKAFIAEHDAMPAFLAGSSNFTQAGLTTNHELNLGYPSHEHTSLVIDWFNEIWDQSEEFDLAGFYEERWQQHLPWIVFLRMLWELYRNDDDVEDRPLGLNLTGFQRDGVHRALRLLESIGGVLVCDEVGLGKTFIAGEIIYQATMRDRQRVLIITPAALRDSTWIPFLRQFGLYSNRVEVATYDDMRIGSKEFLQNLDEYALVVIDEAHNLRNPDAQRSKAVEAMMRGKFRKKMVLLTATPVNNSLWDLETLISYFVPNDSQFASIGIPSIDGYIKEAQKQDPTTLSPEHLFDLMNQVAVRRTRGFIKREYQGETLTAPNGEEIEIEFPTPHLHRVSYDLSPAGERLVAEVVYALDSPMMGPDNPGKTVEQLIRERCEDERRLSMARYVPSLYLLDEDIDWRQVVTTGLLESILLKRLESSAIALENTLSKMIASHEAFLGALAAGRVTNGKALQAFAANDDDVEDFFASIDEDDNENVEPAAAYDVSGLQERVKLDVALLKHLRGLTVEARREDDKKADALVDILRDVAERAARPSKDNISEDDRKKVLIFSSFADTAAHLRNAVVNAVEAAPSGSPLRTFNGRIPDAIYGSKAGTHQEARARTVANFAPATAGRLDESGKPLSENLYDVLFATDVLAEGVNLQQAGCVVSVDLPWNPMRLVQRHGRIDRIGSHHRQIDVNCFFPAEGLDQLLGLEERLQRKIAYANAAIGMGSIIPGQVADPSLEVTLHDVRDQIEQIHDEDPSILDSRGGTSALSGEEYRRRLEKATVDPRTKRAVEGLPFGSGSRFISSGTRVPGWVFCARIGNHAEPWFRFVAAEDDAWEPRLHSETGFPIVVADTLSCLVAADPRGSDTPFFEATTPDTGVFAAWAIAQNHIHEAWMKLTDSDEIQPKMPLALRQAAELVADHGAELGIERQTHLYQCLRGRWEKRIVDQVREIVRSDEPAKKRLSQLAEYVDEEGLEPPPPAIPLPEVAIDEIKLVCWMAVSPASPTGAASSSLKAGEV
jgi:hypothetical protein